MRLLDVKVGDLRLIRMDDWGLGLGCGWFEINYHTWCRVMGFVVCWLGVDPWWVYSVSFRFPFFGVPFGFDESLGEWRVAGGGYRRSVSVSESGSQWYPSVV